MNNFVELKFGPLADNAYSVECSLGIEGQRPAVIIIYGIAKLVADTSRHGWVW
jgi:hypothetical protein